MIGKVAEAMGGGQKRELFFQSPDESGGNEMGRREQEKAAVWTHWVIRDAVVRET